MWYKYYDRPQMDLKSFTRREYGGYTGKNPKTGKQATKKEVAVF
jgi:hypothetical protein